MTEQMKEEQSEKRGRAPNEVQQERTWGRSSPRAQRVQSLACAGGQEQCVVAALPAGGGLGAGGGWWAGVLGWGSLTWRVQTGGVGLVPFISKPLTGFRVAGEHK